MPFLVSDGLTIDSADSERSAHLLERIREEIQAGGPISFETFMQRALYEPDLGYYACGRPQFGKRGDFVTAPTLSPLFAECLAAQCGELMAILDSNRIVEFGAGDGSLAEDLCRTLKDRGTAVGDYAIIEVSDGLRRVQQRRLEGRGPYRWVKADELQDEVAIVLANEVLDALPVARFEIERGIAFELGVKAIQGNLDWQRLVPLPVDEPRLEMILRTLPDGYRSEYNRRIAPWINGVASSLRRGVVLVFDYGYRRAEYYRADRSTGTLQCHLRHHAHSEPFLLPGAQDLTAAVDFSRVAAAGQAAGLDLLGFTSQARFLIACGIDDVLTGRRDDAEYLDLANHAKTLLLPDAMGERIKVMALGRGVTQGLRGFAAGDLRLD